MPWNNELKRRNVKVNNEKESNGIEKSEKQNNFKVMNLLRRKINVKAFQF